MKRTSSKTAKVRIGSKVLDQRSKRREEEKKLRRKAKQSKAKQSKAKTGPEASESAALFQDS